MSNNELESTVKRLMAMKAQVSPDGRPFIAPKDLLSSPAVEQQVRSFAASGLGKRLK